MELEDFCLEVKGLKGTEGTEGTGSIKVVDGFESRRSQLKGTYVEGVRGRTKDMWVRSSVWRYRDPRGVTSKGLHGHQGQGDSRRAKGRESRD